MFLCPWRGTTERKKKNKLGMQLLSKQLQKAKGNTAVVNNLSGKLMLSLVEMGDGKAVL